MACKDFGCPFRTFVTWTQELLGNAFYGVLVGPAGSATHSPVFDPNLFDDSKLKVGFSFSNKLCKALMQILGSVYYVKEVSLYPPILQSAVPVCICS